MKSRACLSAAATFGCQRSTLKMTLGLESGGPFKGDGDIVLAFKKCNSCLYLSKTIHKNWSGIFFFKLPTTFYILTFGHMLINKCNKLIDHKLIHLSKPFVTHWPLWETVWRKESSTRRQCPSDQHWGSPPTTSSHRGGVCRPTTATSVFQLWF